MFVRARALRARAVGVCVSRPPPPARVRVCPRARADMAAAAAMSFDTRSGGAGGEGTVVQYVSHTPDGSWPWALTPSPITTAAGGVAFADFLLEEGNGYVDVIVAPASLDRTKGARALVGGHVMTGLLGDHGGSLWVNGARLRDGLPDLGGVMARGETVRVRYVAATRMVSVVWRGREYDLAPLPAAWDASTYRFGVAVRRRQKMRLTGVSPAGAPRARALRACGDV